MKKKVVTKRVPAVRKSASVLVNKTTLLSDLRGLIHSARQRIATVANSTHTLLCRHVGRRLLKENLDGGRAAYGNQILATVSQELAGEFGQGLSYSSITRMVRFERWDVGTLQRKIAGLEYQRTAQTRPEIHPRLA